LTGAFQLCHIQIAKGCKCDTILNSGLDTPAKYQYEINNSTVTNDGVGDLFKVTVTDRTLSFDCGSLAAGASRLWGNGAGTNDCKPLTTTQTCTAGVPNGDCFSSTAHSGETNKAHV